MSENQMKNKNKIILVSISAILLAAMVVVYFAFFKKKNRNTTVEIVEQVNAELKIPAIQSIIPMTNSALLIEWDPVEQADGYQLYMMGNETDGFVFVGNVFETKKLCSVDGDAFSFKARAFYEVDNVRYVSNFSEPAEIKDVTKFITGLAYEVVAEDAILLKWSKVPGVDGYQVYRSTAADGEYILLDAVKSNKRKCSALTEGKVYYFKVRAFFKEGEEITYGEYSLPIRAVASHYSMVSSEESK